MMPRKPFIATDDVMSLLAPELLDLSGLNVTQIAEMYVKVHPPRPVKRVSIALQVTDEESAAHERERNDNRNKSSI
jgi:hypothetical protein